jgi:hypothetical protein
MWGEFRKNGGITGMGAAFGSAFIATPSQILKPMNRRRNDE